MAKPFRNLRSRWKNGKGQNTEGILSSGSTPSAAPTSEVFSALHDVSFEVARGEVLGVIGRNGAGKSTLLKILSRITEPTSGRIGIKGRVASLLEVGTGFHPELTGRENVFLNGAILGMSRLEVIRKFDEIVHFSGVEKFLDTPVKRYSSGMYVRLAFAVAAHLEPEILIVDEVLAVGDAEFQKKCLGKIKDVAQAEGQTVLFVSHNLGAVEALCDRALYLDQGRVAAVGNTAEVLQAFRQSMDSSFSNKPAVRGGRTESGYRISRLEPSSALFEPRQEMVFTAQIQCPDEDASCHFSMHIQDESDVNVTTVSTQFLEQSFLKAGRNVLSITIRSPWLAPGRYHINAFLYQVGILDRWDDACRFEVGTNVATRGFSMVSAGNAGKALCDFTLSNSFRE